MKSINRFLANVPLLYPLKVSENLCFSDVFREYRYGTLGVERVKRLVSHTANTTEGIIEVLI